MFRKARILMNVQFIRIRVVAEEAEGRWRDTFTRLAEFGVEMKDCHRSMNHP